MYRYELKTFVAVVEQQSFTQAAEVLYLTPTAVMKQMNQLEVQLGIPLFERNRQGVKATESGKALYQEAKFIIEYADKALAKIRGKLKNGEETIRIGSSILNPCKAFMELWPRVSAQFPSFKISIVPFEDANQNILSVISGLGRHFDFFVGVCDSREWLSRANFYKLGTCKKCVAVPVTHKLAAKKELKLSDLYGETLVMVSRGDSPTNDRLHEELEKKHPQIHLKEIGYFYDIDVYNRCAESGTLLLNLDCWKDVHPGLVTLPVVDLHYEIDYGLCYSKSADVRTLRFLDAVKKIV